MPGILKQKQINLVKIVLNQENNTLFHYIFDYRHSLEVIWLLRQ